MKNVKLRTPKIYAQRTNGDLLIEPKKKYFIIVEGSNTEIDYFNGVESYRRELGISELVRVIPLEREYENANDSHPKHLLNAALMKTGRIEAPEGYELLEYDKEDEIWLIFDRDPQNFSKEQFYEVYNRCNKEQFHIGLTNPNFEFWLLLHLPNVKQYDRQELLINKKISQRKRYIDKELSDRLNGYNKKKLCFDKFKDKIDIAVEQEKFFKQNELEILEDLGSNIGKLIDKMKNENGFEEIYK